MRLQVRSSGGRAGFTLLELVAVMVLVGVLAGTVALSVRGHVANARLLAFVDRLEDLDARVRIEARRKARAMVLVFDSEDRQVSQRSESGSVLRTCQVPQGVTLSRLRTVRQDSREGTLQVGVSVGGQSGTYGVELSSSGGRKLWFVVLGMSGQSLRLEQEVETDEIFSTP